MIQFWKQIEMSKQMSNIQAVHPNRDDFKEKFLFWNNNSCKASLSIAFQLFLKAVQE